MVAPVGATNSSATSYRRAAVASTFREDREQIVGALLLIP